MKKLAAIFAFLVSISAQAQQVKSSHLDSLIWAEINVYRSSLGVAPVKKFNNGALRKRSYQLTELNATRAEIDHTRGDSTFVGYSSECIYLFKIGGTGSKKYSPENIDEARLQEIAKIVVNAWINSPNHYYIISSTNVAESTVTSIMESGNGFFRVTVSYHDILKK